MKGFFSLSPVMYATRKRQTGCHYIQRILKEKTLFSLYFLLNKFEPYVPNE